jgi:hypothetical protein
MAGTAKMLVSTEILRNALEFPKTVEIVGNDTGNVELTICSDLVPEGHERVIGIWVKKDGEVQLLRFDPA